MSLVRAVFEEASPPFSATAVIVLYRMKPHESPAFRSLLNARGRLNPALGMVHVVLWDNAPVAQWDQDLPDCVSYVSDARNPGLATAYNRALEIATSQGSDWLITLDQDTALPDDYLIQMALSARRCTQYAGVGAIVPHILADAKIVSPNRFLFGAIPQWYRRGYRGVPGDAVFAFNSGAMLRVAALQQVGGYNSQFWLDNSDAEIFNELHQHGKRVYVAGDIQVLHEFSMKNMSQRMSADRYRNALLAESAFWDLRMNWLAGAERTLRLLLRLIKHRMRHDSQDLKAITRDALLRRLLTSKKKRIEEWRLATRERLGDVLDSSRLKARRRKVSACMASYNGGRYIEAQLSSILSQLHEEDEVVIVDDCSTDDTVRRIQQLNDGRIRLLQHPKNAGVVATFEDALRCATGDILFLCDDDDLWAPTKVEKFLKVFDARPDAELVISKVSLIDEDGIHFSNPRLTRGGKFLPGFWQNVFLNHYQGSAMALRASLLGRVLPFPRRKSFLHDAWIGTRNEVTGGKAAFIDEDLLFYRRHSQNASGTQPLLRQIRKRLELLLAHVSHALHLKTG